MIPPVIMEIRCITAQKKRFDVWLPIIVIWPFVGIVFLAMLPLAYIAELFTESIGIRPFSILLALTELICSLRGLKIDVQSGNTNRNSDVKINFI